MVRSIASCCVVLAACGDSFPAPPALQDLTLTTAEDTPLFISIPLTADEPDAVTLTVVTPPRHGTLAGGQGPRWTYTPAANYHGIDGMVVRVEDRHGTDTASVTVTVTSVNDAPVVTASNGAVTYVENAGAIAIDSAITIADSDDPALSGATIQVTSGCTDPEDVLALASPPAGITVTGTTAATCTLSLTGIASVATYQAALRLITYENTSDAPASAGRTVLVTVDDGQAANHTGSAGRDLGVTAVDDAPVAVNDNGSVAEDAPASAITVLGNDTDVDAGALTIASVSQPAHGTVVITGGGTGVTYAPNLDYCNVQPGPSFASLNGPALLDTFTYTLSPGGSTATVSVAVTCGDDPPIAIDDTATTAEGSTAGLIAVLANDTDIDGGANTIASVTQPDHGTVTIALDGLSLGYTPASNYCNQVPNMALDTFTYTLTPGSSSATVSVTVTCACGQNTPTDFVVGSN